MFSGSPGLSGRRCLSIIRVTYTWNPTVLRDQHFYLSNMARGLSQLFLHLCHIAFLFIGIGGRDFATFRSLTGACRTSMRTLCNHLILIFFGQLVPIIEISSMDNTVLQYTV